MRLFVTGSAGLVGHPLVARYRAEGHEVVGVDLRATDGKVLDFRSPEALALCNSTIDGIIHLAGISRVAWGEKDPALCQAVNVEGTARLLDHVRQSAPQAWFLFASSREVYGEPQRELVREDDRLNPVNVYGRSKLEGEALVTQAREAGLVAASIRLCSIYGGREDHFDRAVPALAWRAVSDQTLHLTGDDAYFDFVHVDDVVEGLMRATQVLSAGERDLPTVHLATGQATTLRGLAEQAVAIARASSTIEEHSPRNFDVSGFCGSPVQAERVLGWKATIQLATGLDMVVADLRANGPLLPFELATLQAAQDTAFVSG